MTAVPAQVEAVCATFLSTVPEGLVTGLYLRGGIAFGEWVPGRDDAPAERGADVTAFASYVVEQGSALR